MRDGSWELVSPGMGACLPRPSSPNQSCLIRVYSVLSWQALARVLVFISCRQVVHCLIPSSILRKTSRKLLESTTLWELLNDPLCRSQIIEHCVLDYFLQSETCGTSATPLLVYLDSLWNQRCVASMIPIIIWLVTFSASCLLHFLILVPLFAFSWKKQILCIWGVIAESYFFWQPKCAAGDLDSTASRLSPGYSPAFSKDALQGCVQHLVKPNLRLLHFRLLSYVWVAVTCLCNPTPPPKHLGSWLHSG